MERLTRLTFFLLLLAHLVISYVPLSDNSLRNIPSPGRDFDIKKGAILAPILRVRVAGTPEIEQVRHHFLSFFQQNLPEWTISFQNSTQETALGGKPITFVNIIVTRDPPWAKSGDVGRLALVAHYDSKLTPKGFIGATDSAAPCAMLMHVARSVDTALTKKWAAMEQAGEVDLGDEKGVQLLLLDGEESFISWTNTDSLYGARSLAAEWDNTVNPAMSIYRTALSSISLFVLLDLLGSARPSIPSYFPTTHWAYQKLAQIESRMRSLHELKSSPNHSSKRPKTTRPIPEPMFLREGKKDANSIYMYGAVEDDHIPFMHRGVEILHLIPSPFPSVWHTPKDDGPHLDMDTTEDWARIVTGFVAEWMELEGHMPPPTTKQVRLEEGLEEREAESPSDPMQKDEL